MDKNVQKERPNGHNGQKGVKIMFNFSFDKRTMYIILAVLIGVNLLTYITNPTMLVSLLFSVPGVLIAITFHEFAHGFAA